MTQRGIREIRITPYLQGDDAEVGIEVYALDGRRLLKVEGPTRIALSALANLIETEAVRI